MAESIVEAAAQGNNKEVQWFLSCGENVNACDDDDNTALHQAVSKGHMDCVLTLLRAGADLDLLNADHLAPIHMAILTKNFDIVKLLIKAGADTQIQDKQGRSAPALARGALGSQSSITKFLEDMQGKLSPPAQNALEEKVLTTEAKETPEPRTPKKPHHDSDDSLPALRIKPRETKTSTQPPKQTVPRGVVSESPTMRSTAAARVTKDPTPPKMHLKYHFLVLGFRGTWLGVVQIQTGDTLADVRSLMEEDEIYLPFAFAFTFRKTGANITHKQEERFLVAHCAYSNNNTTESEHTYQLNLNTSANGDDESEQGDIRSSRSCGTTAREDKQKGPKVYFLEIAKIDKTSTTSRSRAFERD